MKTVDDVRDCLKQIKLVIPTPPHECAAGREGRRGFRGRLGGLERSLEGTLLRFPGQPWPAAGSELQACGWLTAAPLSCQAPSPTPRRCPEPLRQSHRFVQREGDTVPGRERV